MRVKKSEGVFVVDDLCSSGAVVGNARLLMSGGAGESDPAHLELR